VIAEVRADVLRDKDRVRRLLGYLPQEFGFYPRSLRSTCSIIWRD
jgi:ABC-type multidrug transport system ATPase subunit